ncbi:pyridoxamine 5-phosphate oxidase [Altererythrobacter xixiisoli]|uniref:Pyridoxamine 5-phosphate oxidase n=1 Tax=Croceibacterium xixiisoli TaxID=1476466 RepID=A0A6I4TS39_9SPHN|nr:pyridoxamine 5'-phosphate oxidase family protein [Croceibacterium xixiisoli]MXO98766.1 pyridoxamine 5-phosphate oxidase [Croceibacterium xixiisoli]
MIADQQIADIQALESCIGKAPGALDLKVIDHLDRWAHIWIASSTLLIAGFGASAQHDAPASIGITLAGGRCGFVTAPTPGQLSIPLHALDDAELAVPGCGFGGLFLSPGWGETLRVNGRVATVEAGMVRITVEECFLHCAKALIRSEFWKAQPVTTPTPTAPAEFAESVRFLALATINERGHADVSPKGDPAGTLLKIAEGEARFAERPGNRRADSFRNMLTQPRAALLLIIPGSPQVASISGNARMVTDPALREAFMVAGKIPALVTQLRDTDIRLYTSQALQRAPLWPAGERAPGIEPAKIFTDHVKLSKERGLQASLARGLLSVPGLMRRGLDQDYKHNLY